MDPTTSKAVPIGDHDLQVHIWDPNDKQREPSRGSSPRGIVVVYHGFLAHARHPTVRGACELFSKHGYGVVAADLPGHGSSPGLRGYLPFTADSIVDVGIRIADYAVAQFSVKSCSGSSGKELRVILVGSSMGGAMALAVAHRISTRNCVSWTPRLAGVVLLAPMLELRVSGVERRLLSSLASIVPTWKLVPSHCSGLELQYRDPHKRHECETDKYRYVSHWFRVGSASLCVELMRFVRSLFRTVTVPFLVLVADHDVTVDTQGCQDLIIRSPSPDKHMRRYDALHGILCEYPHMLEKIQRDMLDWVRERT